MFQLKSKPSSSVIVWIVVLISLLHAQQDALTQYKDYGGKVVSPTHRPHSSVRSIENPVTSLGIEPATIRLVA
jgi:hypothetical protein